MTCPLPFTVAPAPHEAIDGYLERVSSATGWPLGSVLDAVGARRKVGEPPLVIHLQPEQAAAIAGRLRTPVQVLHSMTVSGSLPWATVTGGWTTSAARSAASRGWFFIAGSRYCPNCVSDGHWSIRWRSALTVACPTHEVLLVDACPHCQGWPRSDRRGVAANARTWTQSVDPRFCTRHVGRRSLGVASRHCGADLAAAKPATATTEVLQAQDALDTALRDDSALMDEVLTATRKHRVIVALASRLLFEPSGSGVWPRQAPPRSTEAVAQVLPDLIAVCDTESVAQAGVRLRCVLERRGVPLDRQHLRHPPTAGLARTFEAALLECGRMSTRLGRSKTLLLPLFTLRAEQIPQLFWRCSMPSALTRRSGKPSQEMRAAFMSLSVARIITGTWDDAGVALGFPDGAGRRWSRYVIEHLSSEQRAEIAAYAMSLTQAMTSAPVQARQSLRDARDLAAAIPSPCGQVDAVWCPCCPGARP